MKKRIGKFILDNSKTTMKYKNIKVGTINLIINIIILLIGCFQFGIKKLLYAIVVIIINSILINLVMYGKFLKRKK